MKMAPVCIVHYTKKTKVLSCFDIFPTC